MLVVVVVPLAYMGYWLSGTAARAGEELLRSRLRQTNARVAAELAANWISSRSALLSFAEGAPVQQMLEERRGPTLAGVGGSVARGDDKPPPELIASVAELPAHVLELTLRDSDGTPVWSVTRAASQLPTFGVSVPIYRREGGDPDGVVEARLLGEAVLGQQGLQGAAAGAVVAVLDPEDGASLRVLPLDPAALADERFQWDGETWVAERRVLVDPRLDIISAAPLAEFSTPFEAAAGRGLGLLLAVALAATALAALLTRRMTGSLGRLAQAADAVSRGDLAVRVDVGRGDEVGRVAEAFNGMTESLRRTLRELSQREGLALVGSFASELAHEVRTPLTSIKLDLQHVEELLPEGSELRDVQRSALEEIARLDRTVGGVLQIARSGRIALEPLDVRDPLLAATHAIEPLAEHAGATVRVDVPSAPLVIPGDRDALQQLFTNVLANAAQAVGEGGTIDVHAAADGGVVVVTVHDNGAGISPEHLARVREPFFSTRPQGTGLGLAIADRVAAAHQAELRIESAPAQGTTVEIWFMGSGMSRANTTG
jgi:two-component system sensor histidine kinase AtoS